MDDTFLPSNTCNHEKIGMAGAIPKDFCMVYLNCPGNLDDGLIEKTIQTGSLAGKSPDVEKDANMTPKLFQQLVVGSLARKFIHQRLTLHPSNACQEIAAKRRRRGRP